PVLSPGTTYTVKLTQPSGTFTGGGTFLSTGAAGGPAGGCAPTITSFTPTCGSASDVVTITGTNLLDASNTFNTNNAGADVFFRSTATVAVPPAGIGETKASQPIPDPSSPTSIQAIVPSGVVDGPIRVLTDVDADAATTGLQGVFSTTSFLTPPPDCPTAAGHTRSISLKLKDKLVAKGTVKSTEATPFTDCAASVPRKT